jgi:4-amino-4-deoxy-L-arabinose transferase-like glycosyltransferase
MKKIILFVILFLAFFLRIFFLNKFPSGFTPDEASFGYDAYSIIKTGKDQWGVSFPLILKSFGDYKSPLLTYLQIPFVALLGLNKLAIRLPNAIIGFLAVLATYLLVMELGKRYKFKIKSWILASIASFLVAISPWHVMMSRGAFEANFITFFLPFGIYLFLKGLKDHKFLIYSSIIFGLNLFSYHSAKFITPVIVTGLIILFFKDLKKISVKNLISPLGIFTVLLILLIYTFSLGGGARIAERSIMQGSLEEGAKIKIESIQNGMNPIVARVLHNKYQVTLKRFISNYRQYFSVRFLFSKGPAETTYGMIPGFGVLYPFEILLLVGLVVAIFEKENRKILIPLFFWLLISPVPAALSTGVGYSANRAVSMIPVIQIIISFGVLGWITIFKKMEKKYMSILLVSLGIFAIYNFYQFINIYFINIPAISAKGMLYGNLEAFYWLKDNADGGINIQVSRRLSEPHIYYAFASKTDPKIYQNSTKNWFFEEMGVNWVDQMGEYSLKNVEFKNIIWNSDSKIENTYFVGRPEEFPLNIKAEHIIYFPDGTVSSIIVKK